MIKLFSKEKIEQIIRQYDEWIRTVARKYSIPAALIKAVLFQEMTCLDLADVAVDAVVRSQLFPKKDSSTGYSQIFGYVGVNAINFAIDRGLADAASLGLPTDRRLDPKDQNDVHMVWDLLNRDPRANIEIATLNLLSCAEEMTGRIDFPNYTDDEIRLLLTRYNANVKHITSYGNYVFDHYQRYLAEEK